MNAKDDSYVPVYVTALTTGGQVGHIVQDINFSDDSRFTLIQTLPDGHYFGILIKDGTDAATIVFKGQLSLDSTPQN